MLHHLQSSRTNLPPVFLLLRKKTKHLSFSDCIQVFLSTSSRSSSSWRNICDTRSFPAKSKRYTVLVSPTWGLVISTFLLKLQLTLPGKKQSKKYMCISANMLVAWLKNQHRHFHGRMSTFATDPLHCSASFHVKRWEKKRTKHGRSEDSPSGEEGLPGFLKAQKVSFETGTKMFGNLQKQ